MSSLSSLLNPAPNSAEGAETRDGALKSSQLTSQPTKASNATGTTESHGIASNRDDAAHALAALSASSIGPPQSWNGHSPTNDRRMSEARRGSAFGAGATLPDPAAVGRKMSSPSLEQYHLSRSPEQQRRSSVVMSGEGGPTLAPIHETENASKELGHDTSHVLSGGNAGHGGKGAIQDIAQNREPSYTREEPTTTQIRRPSDSLQAQSSADDSTDLLQQFRNEASSYLNPDTASNSSRRGSPAAGQNSKSVAALKTEHSAHAQSPLRESSLPVPTTEMPSAVPKKRPAPKGATKKGTASTVKKEQPPKKKLKTGLEVKRSSTPSSQKSKTPAARGKKAPSTAAGTPLASSPAPRSVRTGSSPPRSDRSDSDNEAAYSSDDDEEEEQGSPDPDDTNLYCICRRPDNGTFMIGCDGPCEDWFHGKCVGIREKDKNLIDRYICPNCEKKGEGQTSFKRMCRRPGCRMPARVGGKGKNNGTGSKYCSDECGVAFFQHMVQNKTRGTSPTLKKDRKKSFGAVNQDDEEIGPRGGVISRGELKALVSAAPTAAQFKSLGDGVLSPPATPSPTNTKQQDPSSTFSEAETARLAQIKESKEKARVRHQLLKDRTKFITMAKQAAVKIAEERNVKPKEMCGYDSRISWTEEQFAAWRASSRGAEALSKGTLEPVGEDGRTMDVGLDVPVASANGDGTGEEQVQVCVRKRCQRHHDWAKLALDDTRFEISENSEVMRKLEREEREVRERAGIRAREMLSGKGGSVEVHSSAEIAKEKSGEEQHAVNGHSGEEAGEPTKAEEAVSTTLDTEMTDAVSEQPQTTDTVDAAA